MGFYISIHQITSTFLASGLGLLWGSQQDLSQIANVLALFVDLVILGNISVIVLLSRIKSGADKQVLPQIMLFLVLIMLVTAGFSLR